MLTRIHGKVDVPSRIARRDGQVECLRAEVQRLRGVLVVREKTIRDLRAELKAIKGE
jgi:hypothetical protein